MKNGLYLIVAFLLIACGGEQGIEITPAEIDAYVADKLSESQVFDVSQSLRFSRENETYEVARYMQNDTVILYIETDVTKDEELVRQTFFKEGVPVYVDEFIASNIQENPFTQRKTYLDGANVIESYEKNSASELDLEFIDFVEANVKITEFDFAKPDSALQQKGDFEMKFEEFIIIDPQTYLILENAESDYDVALFVSEEHILLSQLFANPDEYIGRTIFVTHQFVLMNNIERMLFIDGELFE
ncbi:MAG: hypothetical protein GQ574_03815 [Crocinitomix sp.]|nr:hypothetical protein [Crocinitomix sp.]